MADPLDETTLYGEPVTVEAAGRRGDSVASGDSYPPSRSQWNSGLHLMRTTHEDRLEVSKARSRIHRKLAPSVADSIRSYRVRGAGGADSPLCEEKVKLDKEMFADAVRNGWHAPSPPPHASPPALK